MIFKFSYPLSDVVVFIKRRVFSIKEIKDKTVNYGKFNHTCKIMITAWNLAKIKITFFTSAITILEWNTNPILISVETTDYPIENINFPSITVCREDNEQNCFEFVSKIMDHIQFPCFDEGWVFLKYILICFSFLSNVLTLSQFFILFIIIIIIVKKCLYNNT